MRITSLLQQVAMGFALSSMTSAQVAINADGSDPDPSAMLDITSNGSGVLLPRLTVAQRDAIPSPATGLMVYVTDDNRFHFYNGTAWVAIGASGGDGNWTASNNNISNTNTGSVGIGASSPEAKLHVSSPTSGEQTGLKLTQGLYNSLFHHNDQGDFVMRKAINPDQLVLDEDGGVGIGTSTPDPSAAFEVSSIDKGVLIPRMTNAERDAIPTPAAGLEVYSTTDQSFHYYDGTAWQPLGKSGDNNATNEIQQLSLTNDTLSLTNGGSVDLSGYAGGGAPNTLSQNLETNDYWLSGDGSNEGIYINDNGGAYVGQTAAGTDPPIGPGLAVGGPLTLWSSPDSLDSFETTINHSATYNSSDELTGSFTDFRTSTSTIRWYTFNGSSSISLKNGVGLQVAEGLEVSGAATLSNGLEVSGPVAFSGGSPLQGKVWTATNTSGDGEWRSVSALATNVGLRGNLDDQAGVVTVSGGGQLLGRGQSARFRVQPPARRQGAGPSLLPRTHRRR